MHVFPVLVDDLLADRKQYGFDNLNFRFNDYRLPLDAGCVTLRALPDYAIIRIHTGQQVVNEDGSCPRLWEREIRFDE